MNKGEWLICNDPQAMLEFVREKTSRRKLRQLACAFCRRVFHLLSEESRGDLDIPGRDWRKGHLLSANISRSTRPGRHLDLDLFNAATGSAWATLDMDPFQAASRAALSASNAVADALVRSGESPSRLGSRAVEQEKQADLVRDVFGHLFFTGKMDLSWLRWNDGTVGRMASRINEERRFFDLPILHDALLDAGCDDEEILCHCRQINTHIRGCWVIDLLIGKE